MSREILNTNLKESIMKYFKKLRPKAKKYTEDPKKARKLLEEAKQKANQNQSRLKEFWEDLLVLFELVSAWIKREYRGIPIGSIITIIGALIYFVSPIDVVPDFLLGIGLVDDAFVIGLTIKAVKKDIDAYKQWKEEK